MNQTRRPRSKGYLGDKNRKFLVVVDDTDECLRALRYAARRALHTGGGVTLLTIVGHADFQHWLGVEEVMRQEAEDAARARLERLASEVQDFAGITPDLVIKEGRPDEQVVGLIREDEEIASLVLGAGTGTEGPGPLVSAFAGALAGSFPIPVTVVPGDMSDEEIEALA